MEEKFAAIIIDDEESARNILSNLISSFCPEIKVVDKCENLEIGVESIKRLKPQLVFLDIEMPKYAGYEITSFFDQIDFEIIFVTAYDHYAIKAFEVSALDYLLKPIEIDRLNAAIENFKKRQAISNKAENYEVLVESLKTNVVNKIVVPVGGAQKVIEIADIIAIEAQESYSLIHTRHEKVLFSKNLKHFENLLADNTEFVRTHKSWMINLHHMIQYSKTALTIELESGVEAKLSKYKKEDFEKAILA